MIGGMGPGTCFLACAIVCFRGAVECSGLRSLKPYFSILAIMFKKTKNSVFNSKLYIYVFIRS